MKDSHIDHARRTWNEIDINKVRDVSWCTISYFQEKLAARFSSEISPTLFIHNLLRERLPASKLKCLKGAALVCGDMASERGLFEYSDVIQFKEVEGYDLSEVSLARYTPGKIKFSGYISDCNDLVLEKNAYDLIVGSHGIHHVYNLGNLFYQSHNALSNGGLVYLYEWIGPKYLQIPLRNHLVSSLLLLLLFPSRKVRTSHAGHVKGLWIQYPPKAFDASEACNSDELYLNFKKYFKPIRIVMHGGLSYPIFEGIAQNIDQDKWLNKIRIRIVYHLETILTGLGLIRPLFMMVIAETRGLGLNIESNSLADHLVSFLKALRTRLRNFHKFRKFFFL